jgi:hypothetical protein
MVMQADVFKRTEETQACEERAKAAARAKFAEWQKIDLEERPRRIMYFAIFVGVITIVVVALLVHSLA